METPAVESAIAGWSHSAYDRITRHAHDRAGLAFPANRREMTESAIARAMTHLGLSDIEAFARRITSDEAAYNVLLTELTVGETYFFRDPSQWELLRSIVIPDLLRVHEGGRGVRAWSAGCASGEEAYTLAITLKEGGCIDPSVLGTDLCEHRIARAARGVYTKWSMRGTEAAQRNRYFRESAQYFHLLPEFRDVRFRPVNLAGTSYGAPGQELAGLDLVLCRNVLIYIDPDIVTKIFERLVSSLREGGWLMIAASDPQPSQDLPLDVVVTESGLLFRKNSAADRSAHFTGLAGGVTRERTQDHVREAHPPGTKPRATPRTSQAIPARRPSAPPLPRSDVASVVREAREQANRGDLARALTTVMNAIGVRQDSPELYVLQSMLHSELGGFAAAAEAARRALYLDRTLAVAQVALSTALIRAGDDPAAERALRIAEKMLASSPPAQVMPASDGNTAAALLNIVRAHQTLLGKRSGNAR